jgi:hypothetical protein
VSGTVCECDGSGKIVDRIDHSNEPYRDIGNGLQIGGGMSITSRLCGCRKDLEPRDGEARWWSSETVWTETVEMPSGLKTLEISVVSEVPISNENYVVKRRGNRYYPTMVEIAGAGSFITEDVRRLAAALISCADRADAIDAEDADTCGHWWPCDCVEPRDA